MKLPQTGAVILSGDAMHFRENYDAFGVPAFNYDRAQTVASMERIKKHRIEPEGQGHHPARCARHRKIAGVSRVCEVVAVEH